VVPRGFLDPARPADQKIGAPLLRQVWQEGVAQGATKFFVWASPDLRALALYMRLGMLPGCQMFNLAGRIVRPPSMPAGFGIRPFAAQEAADIDLVVRGTRREVDHRFWQAEAGRQGWMLDRGGRPVGYVSMTEQRIGPLAWLDDEAGGAVLSLALREAAGFESAFITAPGVNHQAIQMALDAGLRLSNTPHFLTTAPIGRLAQYVPSGTDLF